MSSSSFAVSRDSAPFTVDFYKQVEAKLEGDSWIPYMNEAKGYTRTFTKVALFPVAVIEVLAREALSYLQFGIDQVLTEDQQKEITDKAKELGSRAAAFGKEWGTFALNKVCDFYTNKINPLFEEGTAAAPPASKAPRPAADSARVEVVLSPASAADKA